MVRVEDERVLARAPSLTICGASIGPRARSKTRAAFRGAHRGESGVALVIVERRKIDDRHLECSAGATVTVSSVALKRAAQSVVAIDDRLDRLPQRGEVERAVEFAASRFRCRPCWQSGFAGRRATLPAAIPSAESRSAPPSCRGPRASIGFREKKPASSNSADALAETRVTTFSMSAAVCAVERKHGRPSQRWMPRWRRSAKSSAEYLNSGATCSSQFEAKLCARETACR